MKTHVFIWTHLKLQLLVAVSALIGLLVIGTVVYHYMEDWSWASSFYFSACTITTVGYGDLAPTTETARLFTAFYALIGVGIAFASLGILGTSYLRRSQEIISKARSGNENKGDA